MWVFRGVGIAGIGRAGGVSMAVDGGGGRSVSTVGSIRSFARPRRRNSGESVERDLFLQSLCKVIGEAGAGGWAG